jgi:hypothetical protein
MICGILRLMGLTFRMRISEINGETYLNLLDFSTADYRDFRRIIKRRLVKFFMI